MNFHLDHGGSPANLTQPTDPFIFQRQSLQNASLGIHTTQSTQLQGESDAALPSTAPMSGVTDDLRSKRLHQLKPSTTQMPCSESLGQAPGDRENIQCHGAHISHFTNTTTPRIITQQPVYSQFIQVFG